MVKFIEDSDIGLVPSASSMSNSNANGVSSRDDYEKHNRYSITRIIRTFIPSPSDIQPHIPNEVQPNESPSQPNCQSNNGPISIE